MMDRKPKDHVIIFSQNCQSDDAGSVSQFPFEIEFIVLIEDERIDLFKDWIAKA
jgi:hypothetical protein